MHLRLPFFVLLQNMNCFMCRWLSGKESAYQYRRCKRCELDPWVLGDHHQVEDKTFERTQ